MRLAIGAALVLALAATASAATVRRVPADYANIQAAEDACVDGDTILVSKGRYILGAMVTFDVPNVKVVGKGAIIDGTTTAGADVDCFYVDAPGVSVTGFKFVNGSNGVDSDGANVLVTRCTFVDQSAAGVFLATGNGAIVESCKFYGCYRGVEGYVANAQLKKNTLRSIGNYGLYVDGSGLRVEGNTLNYIDNNDGIRNDSGTNAVVIKNKLYNVCNEGIQLESANDAMVQGNTVKRIDDSTGIYVDGTSALIDRNKMLDVGGGIECYGNNAEITSNRVTDVHGYTGMEVQADNMLVVGNAVNLGSDDAYGFYLYSSSVTGTGSVANNTAKDMIDSGFYFGNTAVLAFNDVEVSNCTATNCGASDDAGFWVYQSVGSTFDKLKAMNIDNVGIVVESSNNGVYTDCSVRNCNGDGFRVESGDNNDFNDCSAAACGGEGFDNRGTNTTLTGGKYRGDRNDVADSAGGANITLVGVDKSTPGTPVSQVD